MTHVFDFGENDGLYYADITIENVDGFLFLDGLSIVNSVPDWNITDANPYLKSPNANPLPTWGNRDVYTLSGNWGAAPTLSGGNSLSLSASQLASLLKRYTTCSNEAYFYTNSCLAYPQLLADFNLDSYQSSEVEVPTYTGGEKNGTTLGNKAKMMKYQYQHYDDDPPGPYNPPVSKTDILQTYADYIDNNIYNIDGAPTVGNCNLLIVPVWLTDSSNYISISYKSKVREDIEKVYLGSAEDTGWHSVKSYYEAESFGALSMNGVVSDWYEPGISSTTAGGYSSGQTADLVEAAANWYFSNNPGKSRADFDQDDNGYLDGVMLIYAASDYVVLQNNNLDNLWAYCYWNQDPSLRSVSSPGVNVFFWASYDFMYGSNNVASRTGHSSYYGGDTRYCSIDAHTYIHEMGHVFGLDDYYDYGPNSYSPAAGFSMQDYNVGGHDPFSVMAYGWADPYIPTETCQITIGAFQTTHDLILLTPNWNDFDSPFDEYLLLELYTPTGLNQFDCANAYMNAYPKGPDAPGIRLWHVDSRLTYVKSDGVFKTSQITANANYDAYYGVTGIVNNTNGDSDRATCFGVSSVYDHYNQLQLIRNDTEATYHPSDYFSGDHLFYSGDAFDMSTYRSQFYNSLNLNNGSALGWSFSVSITNDGASSTATINLAKA
ncbi:MAG: hypothetical protein K5694_05705 [Bacilli bacterium]|nr:hypothetical protein [Bacilli bacterium]